MKPSRWISLICLTFALIARTDASQPTSTTAVVDWNAFATEMFVAAPQAPLDTRVYSIQHAAIHDALNTIRKRYKFYTGECRGTATDPSAASVDAAVAAAARDVLVAQLPASQSTIDDKYHEALAAIPDGTAELDGIAIGQACAADILARRADDGLATVGPPVPCPPDVECPEYVPTGEPGDYQFTPPFDAPPLGPLAALPGYGNLATFVIKLSNHKLAGPLRLESLAYAADFNYIKAIGRSDSTLRTADQSEIAEFWYEASGVGWNRIANTVIRDAGLDAWKAARIFTLMNFALSDGYVAHFDVKYHYRFWRPITAIRQAAVDGNLFTEPDEAWTPFLETPPIPDYPPGTQWWAHQCRRPLGTLLDDRRRLETAVGRGGHGGRVDAAGNLYTASPDRASPSTHARAIDRRCCVVVPPRLLQSCGGRSSAPSGEGESASARRRRLSCDAMRTLTALRDGI